jgi:hypothetical protein
MEEREIGVAFSAPLPALPPPFPPLLTTNDTPAPLSTTHHTAGPQPASSTSPFLLTVPATDPSPAPPQITMPPPHPTRRPVVGTTGRRMQPASRSREPGHPGPDWPRPAVPVQTAGRHSSLPIWNPYSIVCQAYIRYMSDIFQILTYARYKPGIYLHAKSYDFIGFNACIQSIGRVHWYIEACKEER